MHPLHIKLIRELRRLWAQVLAIALVMAAGVATLIIGIGTYQSLSQTRDFYYESNRFADVFAGVSRARSALRRIAEIDGVLAVDGRIVKVALADIEGMTEPASVLLVSIPEDGTGSLNRLYMRNGRLPEVGHRVEAVVSEIFAKANGFQPGSHLRVVVNGTMREIDLTGIALSPEYIYAMAPGEIMPNEGRFGVLWVPERELAAAYDLDGAFNALALKLVPGASEANVIAAVDAILEPYGGPGAYGRAQTSHTFLDAELTQLESMSRVLPPVFLLVAAFLVNMTLTRLIALEREQIGLLKALGYSSWSIAWHYIEFVVLIGVLGSAVGYLLGIWAGNQLTVLYARFYSFPVLIFSREPSLYLIAGAITLGAAGAGAVRAVWQAAGLPPAVAMLPPAPPTYRRLLGGRLPPASSCGRPRPWCRGTCCTGRGNRRRRRRHGVLRRHPRRLAVVARRAGVHDRLHLQQDRPAGRLAELCWQQVGRGALRGATPAGRSRRRALPHHRRRDRQRAYQPPHRHQRPSAGRRSHAAAHRRVRADGDPRQRHPAVAAAGRHPARRPRPGGGTYARSTATAGGAGCASPASSRAISGLPPTWTSTR